MTNVLLALFFCVYSSIVLANAEGISLDLQDANLSDTIRLLATVSKKNVFISPTINGSVTLHLHHEVPDQAFAVLLSSQGLTKQVIGNIWYITSREELIKRKQEDIKWQELEEQNAPLVTKIWQIQYGKAEDIALLLQDDHRSLLSKRGSVHIDKRTNIIYIRDLVIYLEGIEKLIKRVDVPVKQVLIEARLVSIDNDFENELGINFARGSSDTLSKSSIQEMGRYTLAVARLADAGFLDIKLAALEKTGHARLISSPTLFTANQQPASIEAGEEIPYQEVSENGGTAVVFKKAVLGLKVTPQVLPGNNVLLHMQINQDRPSNKMVQGTPTISTREILTSVLIHSGKTIVLGGIYETGQEKGLETLPYVGQIPILGLLFSHAHAIKNKRELLIFVTPRVIT